MIRPALALALFLMMLLSVGCDAFSSEPAQPASPPAPPAPKATANDPGPTRSVSTAAASPSAVACQSRLWGQVTNTTTGKGPGNLTIQVAGAERQLKTITDGNGQYGFAGLCSGEYAITLFPPSGKPVSNWKANLDGSKTARVDLTYK